MKKKVMLFFIQIFIVFNLLAQDTNFSNLKGPYLGQKSPGETAELFADGIICTIDNAEMCAAFSKDGKEFLFNFELDDQWLIYSTKEINGTWQKPEPLPFSSIFTDRDFTISPDGNKIYFGSNRSIDGSLSPQNSLDIFVSEKDQIGNWKNPKSVGDIINTSLFENYPSVSENGNLYFFSKREDGYGGCDIYMSVYQDGNYEKPKNVGPQINSSKNDWDSFIAPDESYIIFSSQNRGDTFGDQDLYISFKESNNSWSKATNMGASVNSESSEICPSVTLDGKYLFFTSRKRGRADIYWVDAKVIEYLRQ